MNKVSILFLALLMAGVLHSEEAHSQSRQFSVGAGLTSAAVIDEGFSPLSFSGVQRFGTLSYSSVDSRKENTWLLGYASGSLQNRHGRNLYVRSISLLALTFYPPRGDSGLQWGWANGNQFNTRTIAGFGNYTFRADGFTAFGPAAKYATDFRLLNQDFSFQAVGHVQLIGFYIPSGYVSSLPRGFVFEPGGYLSSVLRSAFLFYPGSAVNLGLLPELQWQLGDTSSLGFTYAYDYASFRNIHRSTRSQGNYTLSLNVDL